jgi:poly(hydroxyalkanoate) depolymerase family esterase
VGPAVPAPEPARAFATALPGSGWARHGYSGGAGTLSYWLYVPAGAALGATPLPLIVMLHGCRQTADDFALGTRMNLLAEREGFAVVYPEQSREQNAMGCWNWFLDEHQRRGQGEPELIAAVTRALIAGHGLDPERIYVAGLSAGGAMAAIVGSEYPDLYAAVAVHSGLPAGAASSVAGALAVMRDGRGRGRPSASHVQRRAPPPTIIFHADDDSTVHPANGVALFAAFTAEAPEVMASDSALAAGHSQVTHRLARSADGRVCAEFWQVSRGGHAWFGGDPRGSYTAAGPDASAEVVRFFLARRRGALAASTAQ